MTKFASTEFWIWFAVAAALVAYRSYVHARCGFWEAVFAGAVWPIWLVGMAFRIGEESVGFRWPDASASRDAEADAAEQGGELVQPCIFNAQSDPAYQQSLTFAYPNEPMTTQDKSKFLVDLSHVDLKYGDAIDIYNLLADKAKAGSRSSQ